MRSSIRAVLPVVVAALLTLSLAACGTATPTPAPAAQQSGAFPVTITHAFGTTTIPAEPKRVVAIGFNEADFVLALGEVPVGVRDFIGEYDEATRPWARQALAGAQPVVVGGNDVDFEKVASLKPDLIMGVYSFMDQATYTKLAKIAPTVAQPSVDGAAATWQEQTRTTGKALGRDARAEQVIADTGKKFTDARAAHPQLAGRTIAVDLVVDGVPYLLGADDLRSQVFTGLGIAVPATTATLSNETQSQLDKDAIVVIGQTKEQLAGNAVFQGLKAVKAGRVVYTGGYGSEFAGATGFGSPLSLPTAIDDIAPQLAAVLQ